MTANAGWLAIGWDVGGWNCDKNGTSRDAVVILSASGELIGTPWRGNLRETLNRAGNTDDFIARLMRLCSLEASVPRRVVLAIDAPLGLPAALIALHHGTAAQTLPHTSQKNPYLFRMTERRLADEGVSPLSAIKDMIGSQTSKAMHVVRRFAPEVVSPGVWGDGLGLEVIETYPALVRHRRGQAKPEGKAKDIDIADAHVCAEVAHIFATCPDSMDPPPGDIDLSEGWIWAPRKHP